MSGQFISKTNAQLASFLKWMLNTRETLWEKEESKREVKRAVNLGSAGVSSGRGLATVTEEACKRWSPRAEAMGECWARDSWQKRRRKPVMAKQNNFSDTYYESLVLLILTLFWGSALSTRAPVWRLETSKLEPGPAIVPSPPRERIHCECLVMVDLSITS